MINQYVPDLIYDAGPTGCGELIMNLFLTMKKMEQGQIIEVISYDKGAREDIPAWCRLQSQRFLGQKDLGETSYYYIEKYTI
ncbi:sulfurtransferase TusA family protein [Neobacillus sp. PS3-40]|uniref:sulfurtransferase TusA family protein n=1 Tax=Neobacillus sp. PS3-40 TaxID=3070679 RepID=UPI0027E12088|nr:sulfurtransferase TusA family protein [Neobacillus sp. PS3-40]WML45770.1 sulfurtransferase TusA family protein [Neobacillus sp. PS3-40]